MNPQTERIAGIDPAASFLLYDFLYDCVKLAGTDVSPVFPSAAFMVFPISVNNSSHHQLCTI